MARLAGAWRDATLEGDVELVVGGRLHHVPEGAELKVVIGSDGIEIAHVRHGRRVYVLSALGVLLETDAASKSRAAPVNWATIAAT